MVIEFLTFEIDPAQRHEWLEVEARHWSSYLATCDGFVGKEMWVSVEDPRLVHAVIRWESQDAWDGVSPEKVKEIDAAMGPWSRVPTMRSFEVVRQR